jgi:hypothetical protein
MNAARREVPRPLGRALLRSLVVANPLFLLSALVMLGGAWLWNPPDAHGARPLALVVPLFLAIQLYEVCLLGAGLFFSTRRGLERDVRSLGLVLAPFLLDVTFTGASLAVCIWHQFPSDVPAWIFAGTFVVLASVKLALSLRSAGRRIGGTAFTGLAAALVLVVSYPLFSARLVICGTEPPSLAFLGGLALAALLLLVALGAWTDASRLVRAVSPLVLGVAALHVGSTCWSNRGSLALAAFPPLIALGLGLTSLLGDRPLGYDPRAPLAVPLLGVLLAGVADGRPFGAAPWSLALAGYALVQALLFARTRSVRFAVAAALAADLARGGSLADSLALLGTSPLEAIAFLALFLAGVWKKANPVALAVPVLLATLVVLRDGHDGLHLLVASDVLALSLLVWTHATHGRGAAGAIPRFLGSTLIYAPAVFHAATESGGAPAQLVLLGSLGFLVLLACVTRVRLYAFPALLIPASRGIQAAPATAFGWGVLGVALGFVLVALGVFTVLRRERLLAWIDGGEPLPGGPS